MELTKELIKFCCKNLIQLERLIGSDDWDVHRRADSRMGVFRDAMRARLRQLGLPDAVAMSRYLKPPIGELEQVLRAIEALAKDGSLDALEDLADLAMIAAKCVRNVDRMIYTREHQPDVPWHKKPADQHGVIAAPSSPDQISDADVSKMLRGLEKRITSDGPDAQEQEGLSA